MAYTIIVKHRDGTTSREYHKFPACPPAGGGDARVRRQKIDDHLRVCRDQLKHSRGWTKKKNSRMVASIPVEVFSHIFRNEGAEAARDPKYLIRKAKDLGLNVQVSKGRF